MAKLALLLFLLAPAFAAQPDTVAALQHDFRKPPDDCRIMVRWWWFGPAVTQPELEREMRQMKEGGIGGFEVQAVYPLTLDEPAQGLVNLPYLSKGFLNAVGFTAKTVRSLGLRMDMTLGSGWPFGGPEIPLDLASRKLRISRTPSKPGPGETYVAAFREPRGEIFFYSGHTGQKVKRAAVGAEGYVLDHYSRAAIDRHLSVVGDKLAEAAGPGSIRAMFCDSLEVYGADWTTDLLQEFRRRRGYDFRPYLPALVEDIGQDTAAVRHDYGETLTELLDDRFLAPVQEWCHQHHVLFRAQAYGTPPASLTSYRLVDLPEGEGAAWNQFSTSRWASSAGHALNRPVISAETWTWIHSPAFRATPLDFKAEADQQFLEGINQLVGHGWPYSPKQAGEPGWRFYAAGALNAHNPWWPVMPDLTAYLQRVSFLLRQGRPVNDIALYIPQHDAWAEFTAGHVSLSQTVGRLLGQQLIPALLAAGYNFDLVDDASVASPRHRIVLLPNIVRIPVATLRKLSEFSRRGGILVATNRLPSEAPGLLHRDEDRKEIDKLVHELPIHLVRGGDQLGPELAKLLHPDVTLSPAAPAIGFVHRATRAEDVYFFANTENTRQRVQAEFRVEGKNPEWWNPFTGSVTAADVVSRPKGGTVVSLDLEPYGSRVLVFTNRRLPRPVHPHSRDLPAPLDLSRQWKVTFTGLRKTENFDSLHSWTDDTATRYYAGAATYQKSFEISSKFLKQAGHAVLDLGEGKPVPRGPQHGTRAWLDGPVCAAAEVYVNGRRAGSVWHPPYRIDVSGLLHSGSNDLKIVVYNLAINEIAGKPLPDYTALNARYGKRFDPQDFENLTPVPAGLMGPVRLVAR